MTEIKRVPFDHDGEEYEVVVFLEYNQLKARAMHHGRPVNGLTSCCKIDEQTDLDEFLSGRGVNALKIIIASAQQSVGYAN